MKLLEYMFYTLDKNPIASKGSKAVGGVLGLHFFNLTLVFSAVITKLFMGFDIAFPLDQDTTVKLIAVFIGAGLIFIIVFFHYYYTDKREKKIIEKYDALYEYKNTEVKWHGYLFLLSPFLLIAVEIAALFLTS